MKGALTDAQKRLYARQVLVAELGAEGQARLCDARIDVAGDERAAAVAVDYLARAGVSLSRDDARTIAVGDATVLQATAGAAALVDCAAWLQGAFAAVEAIKQIAGVGSASALDPQLVLSEVRWRALP